MPAPAVTAPAPPTPTRRAARPATALVAATLVFFVITLDAVIVNVALPRIRAELGGGIAGLQWVVDGYTLMFAALLLSSGSLADRVGARRTLTYGMALFVLASAACGAAPTLGMLVAARFVQGAAAAAMMPASMALLGQAFPNPVERARAIAMWAMGGAIASSAGPVLGGVLTLASWRLIFLVNVPVGVLALLLMARTATTRLHRAAFDWVGQLTGVLAMAGLTFGVIEAGDRGFTDPRVVVALGTAAVAGVAFLLSQARVAHPMVPLGLFRARNAATPLVIGFAFMIGYYGLPFVLSLYLQQVRALSPLGTGVVFLPMMLVGLVLTPFAPRIVQRLGARTVIVAGLASMVLGLCALAFITATTPLPVVAALMVLVGVAGPLVMPPTTAILLDTVPPGRGGVASGVFNTSRQVGGALAVAVFGALLGHGTFMSGLRASLLTAAVVALLTAAAATALRPVRHRHHHQRHHRHHRHHRIHRETPEETP
ncbi:MFS transporter [Intrasporangium flavum]|uniref:MFS transporter n=1 Tax=Intrasporangium flavum TaxID=1428657 RepID=UPI00096F9A7A|nr:MFS transporter [Intrasporangium flavum]